MMEVEMFVESKLKELVDPVRERRAAAILSLQRPPSTGRSVVSRVGRRFVLVGSWLEQLGYRMSPVPEAPE